MRASELIQLLAKEIAKVGDQEIVISYDVPNTSDVNWTQAQHVISNEKEITICCHE